MRLAGANLIWSAVPPGEMQYWVALSCVVALPFASEQHSDGLPPGRGQVLYLPVASRRFCLVRFANALTGDCKAAWNEFDIAVQNWVGEGSVR